MMDRYRVELWAPVALVQCLVWVNCGICDVKRKARKTLRDNTFTVVM